ncbi:hypothetical protein [Methylococcus mesophilus]|uniref:hypothetical protein n=1 Tax=Methylococcus mesophilus TaxID=2993564 RepID=UPI00224AEBBE|nr:hypothetical protein [Methylococcus mesophilus]UZR29807.1 hypothetical protein OOT43_03995 [Methylococcus mesophilus]
MDEGKFESLSDIAAAEGMNLSQVSRIARLVHLAPGIAETCLAENDPELMLEDLNRHAHSVDWAVQA